MPSGRFNRHDRDSEYQSDPRYDFFSEPDNAQSEGFPEYSGAYTVLPGDYGEPPPYPVYPEYPYPGYGYPQYLPYSPYPPVYPVPYYDAEYGEPPHPGQVEIPPQRPIYNERQDMRMHPQREPIVRVEEASREERPPTRRPSGGQRRPYPLAPPRKLEFERKTRYRGIMREKIDRYEEMREPVRRKRSSFGKKLFWVLFVIAVVCVNIWVFTTLVGDKDKPILPVSGSDVSGGDLSPSEIDKEAAEAERIHKLALELCGDMTDEEKAGQLLLLRSNDRTMEEFTKLIADCKAGGVVLFKSNFTDKTKAEVKAMISSLQEAAGGKLLICVDEEGGTVVRLSSNTNLRTEKYKSPQEVYKAGGMDGIIADAENKCDFLKSFGVNVNFGPVADVATSEDAFMYKRAFGKNAEKTSEFVSNVVTVMKQKGVGMSIKHFPGYGNSKGDTHEGLDENDKGLNELRASDLKPFEAGIAAGADAVMVTHTIIKSIDKKNPASLSPKVTALIRDELSFKGVLITDGLDMGAINEFCGKADPCVMAVQGGCDLMCTPSKPESSFKALVKALGDGTISQERIDESVVRILEWKIRLGLYGG